MQRLFQICQATCRKMPVGLIFVPSGEWVFDEIALRAVLASGL